MTAMSHWIWDSAIYHLYPLGACDAPRRNDFARPVEPRLERLFDWIERWRALGVNALLIGPIFESTAHGYDTADLFRVDRRLGDWALFQRFARALKDAGIRLLLDGVFRHVGRDFWAFRDVREKREQSEFCGWFSGLRFDRQNGRGDGFAYDCWNGCDDLVKLNHDHPDVRAHLFSAIEAWVRDFDIAGLRLDAADAIELGFLSDLSRFCRSLRPDFFLMGEVVHGDYRRWACDERLDATTNYECFKGLYSSFNDRNLFEIAYSFRRQFGDGGLYVGRPLYAFADNHDVNRVASQLRNPAHLFPLHLLLFTMPGVPSIYYGSEWGIRGRRTRDGDHDLRPSLPALDESVIQSLPAPWLEGAIRHLIALRRSSQALCRGDYREVLVRSEQLAFTRTCGNESVLVAVNAASQEIGIELPPDWRDRPLDDLLCQERLQAGGGVLLPAHGGRVLRRA